MERVMEIANYVMKQVLFQGDSSISERNLIADLIELGYQPNEIEAAFRLLYSIPTSLKTSVVEHNLGSNGYRIFSKAETRKLSIACQSEILRLSNAHLISAVEREKIMSEAVDLEIAEVGLKELELILHKVIQDEERLLLILYHPQEMESCLALN